MRMYGFLIFIAGGFVGLYAIVLVATGYIGLGILCGIVATVAMFMGLRDS